ncbi:RNA exonuclease 4 [Rhynchocyon petersi]
MPKPSCWLSPCLPMERVPPGPRCQRSAATTRSQLVVPPRGLQPFTRSVDPGSARTALPAQTPSAFEPRAQLRGPRAPPAGRLRRRSPAPVLPDSGPTPPPAALLVPTAISRDSWLTVTQSSFGGAGSLGWGSYFWAGSARVVRNQRRGRRFQPVSERKALPGAGARVCASRGLRGVVSGARVTVERVRDPPGPDLVSPGSGRGGVGAAGVPSLGVSPSEAGCGRMAKVPGPARAPGSPATGAGLVQKRHRKRNKARFWKSQAQDAGKRPGSGPAPAVRPPQAPEEFSQNWKALQELLKQKPQVPEKPLLSQTGFRKQPHVPQPTRSKVSDLGEGEWPSPADTTNQGPSRNSETLGSLKVRKVPAAPTKASGAEHTKTGITKRTNGQVFPAQRDIKQKKRKAEAPALPTEDDIWFDDVDPQDIEAAIGPEAANVVRRRLGQAQGSITLVKEQGFGGLTKALALDCEMVGVGPKGAESIAARVSIVNQHGKCVYDKYIRPAEPVTDYRTAVSGIRPADLKQGEELAVVQKEVADMLKGRILVGHALHNDLKVLFLHHPKKQIRDTQKYKPFRRQVNCSRPSLKLLSERILGIRVQQSEHCSLQDAQAAMRLYIMVKRAWESTAKNRHVTSAAPDSRRT